ncbi:MAG: nitrate reductase molybdenum cofactor assembly chaperone, partial [Ottowia sp.]|nr:nitrate reductase molybdenum cofactor assembly chaperone [Ottowia sp.]
MADAPASKAYKWLSALLCYPEQELLDALPHMRQSLGELPSLAPQQQALALFLDHMQSRSLRQLQEAYVATFDRSSRQALYLFEHIHGEARDRGAAMVD